MGEITLSKLKALGARRLREVSECPEFEAGELLFKASGITKNDYIIKKNQLATDEQYKSYEGYIERRISGEPLQYILGFWEFYSLKFLVEKGVLIPRADTETLVDEAISAAKDKIGAKVLDLCCGSGCVGIALAKNLKNAELFSVDYYDCPLCLTEKNARLNGIDGITVIRGDVLKGFSSFEPYAGEKCRDLGKAERASFCPGNMKFDLIVSNPPYIPSSDINGLSKEVRSEPPEALDGGEDGLEFYRAILKKFAGRLDDGGSMLVEIGYDQGPKTVDLFNNYFKYVRCVTDLSGNDRVVVGRDKR